MWSFIFRRKYKLQSNANKRAKKNQFDLPSNEIPHSEYIRPYVQVRMEAIGGQGAHSAGKILAEASVLKHQYTGNHFSSFGSEKRGTPVRSFVRFAPDHRAIRSASFIQKPDLLIIFHELLMESHQEVLSGCTDDTDIIINTNKSPKDLAFPKSFIGRRIATLDATEIARRNECGLNAVMLGAASVLLPEINSDLLQECMVHFFSKLSKAVLEKNVQGFKDATEKIKMNGFKEIQSHILQKQNELPELGWQNAPIGGVITNPGNSILKDHSASRKGYAPLLDREICFHCGYCDMVCPDFCFVWEKDEKKEKPPKLLGIDYQFCKACQKCVVVCPVEALTVTLEKDIPIEERQYKVIGNKND